jgi:intracellular multiplication protein IcmO
VPAQARSLGFSAIFAGQDLPAFQKSSKEEAASIGANTNIKICMKLEDPTETWDFFTKTAGEAYVTKVDSFQTKETSLSNSYSDTKSSSFEKRARVDLLDLKDQSEGEAHIFFRSKIVRARMFYANPAPVKRLKLNQFLKVEPPPDVYLAKLSKQLETFSQVLAANNFALNAPAANEEIEVMSSLYKSSKVVDPIERGVDALIAFYRRNQPEEVEELIVPSEPGQLTLFSPLNNTAALPKLRTTDERKFSEALLNINTTRDGVMNIEQFSGEKEKVSGTIANEVIKDLQAITSYPPITRFSLDVAQLNESIKTICASIARERANASES